MRDRDAGPVPAVLSADGAEPASPEDTQHPEEWFIRTITTLDEEMDAIRSFIAFHKAHPDYGLWDSMKEFVDETVP